MRAPPPAGLSPHTRVPAPRARPAGGPGENRAGPRGPPGLPSRRGRKGPRGLPGSAGTPPHTAVYLRRGLLASPLDAAAAGTGGQRRCGWERRCQLTSANPGAVLGRRGGGYLSGVDLLRTRKFRRPFCHPALVRAANAVVKRCHKGQLLILMFLSDLCFCMPPPLAPPATEPNCRIYNHRTGVNYLLNLQLC